MSFIYIYIYIFFLRKARDVSLRECLIACTEEPLAVTSVLCQTLPIVRSAGRESRWLGYWQYCRRFHLTLNNFIFLCGNVNRVRADGLLFILPCSLGYWVTDLSTLPWCAFCVSLSVCPGRALLGYFEIINDHNILYICLSGWYCRDRVSSCNIYAVQQDTHSTTTYQICEYSL